MQLCPFHLKGRISGISGYLSAINWGYLFSFCTDIDEMYTLFMDVLYAAFERFVPKRRTFRGVRQHQYPAYIHRAILKKRRLWRMMKRNGGFRSNVDYKMQAARCRSMINRYHVNVERRILGGNNLGAFYKYVNSKLTSSSGIAPLRSSDGSLIVDPALQCHVLNDCFCNVFSVYNNVMPLFCSQVTPGIFLADVQFDPYTVGSKLKALSAKVSHTPDGIPQVLLKKLWQELSIPLTYFHGVIFRRQAAQGLAHGRCSAHS